MAATMTSPEATVNIDIVEKQPQDIKYATDLEKQQLLDIIQLQKVIDSDETTSEEEESKCTKSLSTTVQLNSINPDGSQLLPEVEDKCEDNDTRDHQNDTSSESSDECMTSSVDYSNKDDDKKSHYRLVCLPSADKILASTKEACKRYRMNTNGKKIENREIHRMTASQDLFGNSSNIQQHESFDVKEEFYFGLPTATWRVPLTAMSDELTKLKKNSKECKKRLTIKEKEKLKRFKGQCFPDTWKSEEWMRLRQTYD